MKHAPCACVGLRHNIMLKTIILIVLLIILSIISVFIGVSNVNINGLLHANTQQWLVFTVSRLPRVIAIIISGAGLAIGGLIIQQIANNKFISPTTAGTLSSAKMGIILSIIVFPGGDLLIKATFAVIVAFLGSLIFMQLLRSIKFTDIIFVPLVGLMFSKIIEAGTEFFAYKFNLLQTLASWLHGDFSLVIEGRYEILYVVIPAVTIAFIYAQQFSIAGLGRDTAKSLGLNYNYVMYLGLIIVSVITALIVVIAGSIPFVGLIVPNIVSLYYGDNVKNILPFTAILGSCFVLVCDILARVVIFPYEVSVSSVIGTIGSAVFIYLIYRRYRYG